MTDRFLTAESFAAGVPSAPALVDLRRLERLLQTRLADFDVRVDDLLQMDGPSFLDAAADLDVLCAAIEEARELLVETRVEAKLATARRRERRSGRRRWG